MGATAKTGVNYPSASGKGEVRVEAGEQIRDASERVVGQLVAEGHAVRDAVSITTPEEDAYHAEDGKVYHVSKDCPIGNNIEPDKRKSGKGSGLRLCKECLKS